MEFEIEKDFAPGADQFTDKSRAFRCEELQAYLVQPSRVADPLHQIARLSGAGHVQSNNQVLPRSIWRSGDRYV